MPGRNFYLYSLGLRPTSIGFLDLFDCTLFPELFAPMAMELNISMEFILELGNLY